MHTLYISLVSLHIVVGFISLLLFWIPVTSRKGGKLHVLYGRWYVNAMYVVSISAMLLAVLLMVDPIAAKYPSATFTTDELIKIVTIQNKVGLFLLAISVLVLASIRHGILTLRAKKDHSLMRDPGHLLLNGLLVAMGLTLIARAGGSLQILFYIFGVLSISLGAGNLRYCFIKQVAKMEWMVAHMGAMIGAGIGSYTAFFVFGANRVLSDLLTGYWSVVPWVLPGVVGAIAINFLNRKYRRQFNPVVKAKSIV